MEIIVAISSLLATLIPTLVYAWTLRWFDRYEKEPFALVVAAFVWGAVPAVILALIGEVIADVPLTFIDTGTARLVGSGGVAPFVEELAKGIFVLMVYWIFQHELDDPIDGIIYGALVGFGFAMTENWVYFISAWLSGGWGQWSIVVAMRQFLFGMNHAFFTSLTGLGVGLARLSAPFWVRVAFVISGWGAAMLFHAIHNVGVTLAHANLLTMVIGTLSDWGGILLILIVVLIGLSFEKKWVQNELQEEIQTGLIDAREYARTCSYRRRLEAYWDAVLRGQWRRAQRDAHLTQVLTELAFKKYQMRVRGQDYAREIAQLRQVVTALRAAL